MYKFYVITCTLDTDAKQNSDNISFTQLNISGVFSWLEFDIVMNYLSCEADPIDIKKHTQYFI